MDAPKGRGRFRRQVRGKGRGRFGGRNPINNDAESHVESQGETPPVVQPVPPLEVVDPMLLLKLTQGVKKLGVVPFLGGIDYFVAKTWIRNMVGNFKMITCTEIQKVQIAVFFLQEEAHQWWDSVERARNNDVSTMEWVEFEGLFLEKYFPSSVEEKLEVEFDDLKQGTMSARDYDARFAFLYQFVHPMDPTSLARKFERGLNSKIRMVIVPLRLHTVVEVLESVVASEEDNLAYKKEQATQRDYQNKGKVVAESSNTARDHGGPWKKQKTRQQAPARFSAAPIRVVPVRQVSDLSSKL